MQGCQLFTKAWSEISTIRVPLPLHRTEQSSSRCPTAPRAHEAPGAHYLPLPHLRLEQSSSERPLTRADACFAAFKVPGFQAPISSSVAVGARLERSQETGRLGKTRTGFSQKKPGVFSR
ncbi:hypothetical protein WMY93_028935 [Mugilogobius chulae]|uniref:Uncharacterized protein n=1 Tax=Mugilogobius chulae TaxID=88201 RepID=A0AAW0N1L8_9GOBI